MPSMRKQAAIDSYLRLVTRFPLRRLRTDKEHREAMKLYDELSGDVDAGHNDQGTLDYVDMLVNLIEEYEKSRNWFDTSHVTAADLVRFLLGERDMSVSALAKAVGMSQGTLNDMLNGKRDWSKSAIVKLSDYFKLNPAMFLRAR